MKIRKKITVNELLDYLQREDVTRFVHYQESSNEKCITFCNTLRIKKIAGKRNVVFERFEITGMHEGQWVAEPASKQKKLTDRLTILFLKNAKEDRALIQQILFNCVKNRIEQLLAQDYVITGTTNIQLVTRHSNWIRGGTLWMPEHAVMRDDLVRKSLLTRFEVKTKPLLKIKRPVDLTESEDNNFYSYIVWMLNLKLNQGFRNSAKLINKSIRQLLDKGTLSNVFKYNVYRYDKTAFQVTLSDYITFSNKFSVNGDCGSLIPLLRLIKTKRLTKIDGSNKSFTTALGDFGFNKGDISFLRKESPIVVKRVTGLIEVNPLMKDVYIEFLKNKLLRRFPKNIVVQMLEGIHDYLKDGQSKKTVFITIKWLEYYQRFWKERGYKESLGHWHNATSSWRHALDWCRSAEPLLHKNQNWASINEISNNWHEQESIRRGEFRGYIPDKWNGISDSEFRDNEFYIEEITEGTKLLIEGREMHHCVFDYARQCVERSYAVFSIKHKTRLEERGTLGIGINSSGKCSYDQLQGVCNSYTNAAMESFAKRYIAHFNAKPIASMTDSEASIVEAVKRPGDLKLHASE